MNLKKCILIVFCVLLIIFSISYCAFAADTETIITDMAGVKNDLGNKTGSGIGKVINIVIGLLQVAGSGISIVVVTLLGIKYILASVEQKAEIKKQAVPIVIGCVLLFGAVNIMAALEGFTQTTLS